jgi:hypothetical protein
MQQAVQVALAASMALPSAFSIRAPTQAASAGSAATTPPVDIISFPSLANHFSLAFTPRLGNIDSHT